VRLIAHSPKEGSTEESRIRRRGLPRQRILAIDGQNNLRRRSKDQRI
jgi:hypothetical protein